MLGGSEVFLVTLRQESVYFFNATDEGDNFTVTISGDQPVNSSLENNGSLYTFTWSLQELDNRTITFLASDSMNAVSMLDPQILFCVCENNGTCTLDGLLSTDQNPLIMNCECQQGKHTDIWQYSVSLLGHVSKIVSIMLSKLAIVPILTHCCATVTTHF